MFFITTPYKFHAIDTIRILHNRVYRTLFDPEQSTNYPSRPKIETWERIPRINPPFQIHSHYLFITIFSIRLTG